MKRCFSLMTVMLLAAVACQTEKMDSAPEYGILDIALSGEPSIGVEVKSQKTLTDAEAADYTINIYDAAADDEPVYTAKHKDFKAQVLPLGTYYVTAESCTKRDAEANYGQMRLAGQSKNIVLSRDAISQTAQVDCEVANAKVAFEFDASVAGQFNDLKVTLYRGGMTTTIREDDSSPKVFWFNPATISYTISGNLKNADNKKVTLPKTLDVNAKDNYKVIIKLNLDNGQIKASPTVIVDDGMNDKEDVAELTPFEE